MHIKNQSHIDNAENIDIIMPMFDLLEYSGNYFMASGSFWNCYSDEKNDDKNKNDDNNIMINNNKITTSKSFEYKTKIIEGGPNNIRRRRYCPIKICNFWRSLDLPLINSETELDLRWTKNCLKSKLSRKVRTVDPNAGPVVYDVVTAATGAIFEINYAKLMLNFIKKGLRRKISCNKYKSKMTAQPKSNNLDYLIDPTFINNNRLFVLSFKNGGDDPTSYSFDECYMPLLEIKDFNALIDNKPLFDQLLKIKKRKKKLSKC